MPALDRLTRFRAWLDKVFDLKGPSTQLQVLDDVMPVVELLEPSDPEWARLREEDWCIGQTNVSSTAVNTGKHFFTNDAGSNVLAVLDRVVLSLAGATDLVRLYLTNPINFPAPPAGNGAFKADLRVAPVVAAVGLQPSVARVTAVADAVGAPGQLAGLLSVAAGVVQLPLNGLVIPPGQGFVIAADPVVATTYVTWFWREKRVEASELRA